MSKISVIVPVYNSQRYLSRCIESILAQTYIDFELLLINDGSNDLSGVICDNYALKDSRIRVYHKENGGVSSARNLGLENAKGKWISFVDSDDWVDDHYLESLYQDGAYDFVTCYWRVTNDQSYVSILPKTRGYYGRDQIVEFLDLNIGNVSYPFCRLYSGSIISKNNLRFDENIHFSEDALFNIRYLQNVATIRQVGNIEYNYEKHIGSLSNKFISWNDMDYTISVLGEEICQLENKFDWKGDRLFQYHIWGGLLRKYLTHLQFNLSFVLCVKGLREIVKNEYALKCFSNSSHSAKSSLRKVLDFFICNRFYVCAAFMLKVEGYLLKKGIIHRT